MSELIYSSALLCLIYRHNKMVRKLKKNKKKNRWRQQGIQATVKKGQSYEWIRPEGTGEKQRGWPPLCSTMVALYSLKGAGARVVCLWVSGCRWGGLEPQRSSREIRPLVRIVRYGETVWWEAHPEPKRQDRCGRFMFWWHAKDFLYSSLTESLTANRSV